MNHRLEYLFLSLSGSKAAQRTFTMILRQFNCNPRNQWESVEVNTRNLGNAISSDQNKPMLLFQISAALLLRMDNALIEHRLISLDQVLTVSFGVLKSVFTRTHNTRLSLSVFCKTSQIPTKILQFSTTLSSSEKGKGSFLYLTFYTNFAAT